MVKSFIYIRCKDCKNYFHNSEKGIYYDVIKDMDAYNCVFCNGKYELCEYIPPTRLRRLIDKIKRFIKYETKT